ncbi:MFS transporter [Candidatus Gracilibacteria bacterium 28_42_T64]|nr:MFS transporter [Candidatus Gracilibacteria bacterium 28_42_T64]
MVYLLTFVNGLSFTMMIPIFPFLLKTYGQPEIMLGFLVASYSFFQFFGAPIIGSLSDKYGRKPVMLLTQGGTFFSWIILGIAYFLPETHIFGIIFLPILAIFLSRIVDGITGGNMSVISAMISDMTTKAERTVIFGKNSAVMGVTLIIGPSLGAFSMGTEYGFLGTAIVGGIVSAITLGIMFFKVTESLKEENKQKELQISFKDMNIIRKISKYWHITTIKFSVVMKLLMFLAFTMYTTISVLYLIDKFGFSPLTVGYYLMITGSFLIFHQSFSIQPIVKRVGDLHGLIVGQGAMFLGYLGMGLSPNIILYTIAYFVAVLGISLSMTTLQALFSKSADERSQGEVMGISSSLDSLMSMVAPVLGSFLYAITDISIFIIISVVPLISILVYVGFFRKMLARNKKFCE